MLVVGDYVGQLDLSALMFFHITAVVQVHCIFTFPHLSLDLQESNVKLKLTIVDTVGYGDQINKDDR